MATCPYCSTAPVSEDSCIVKEKGKRIHAESSGSESAYDMFYVRCCPACFRRRRRVDTWRYRLLMAGPLLLLAVLPVHLLDRYQIFEMPDNVMHIVGYVMMVAFALFPISAVLYKLLPFSLNLTHHHKYRVSRALAAAHDALLDLKVAHLQLSGADAEERLENEGRFYDGT